MSQHMYASVNTCAKWECYIFREALLQCQHILTIQRLCYCALLQAWSCRQAQSELSERRFGVLPGRTEEHGSMVVCTHAHSNCTYTELNATQCRQTEVRWPQTICKHGRWRQEDAQERTRQVNCRGVHAVTPLYLLHLNPHPIALLKIRVNARHSFMYTLEWGDFQNIRIAWETQNLRVRFENHGSQLSFRMVCHCVIDSSESQLQAVLSLQNTEVLTH